MNCASCGAQIPASFGHAIRKNECPACGSVLMDEESMALIEELRVFVLNTVKVREETADTLAMALIAAYEIRPIDGAAEKPTGKRPPGRAAPRTGTAVQRTEGDDETAGDGGIVKASDLFDASSPISATERDEILKERIENRLIAQAMIPSQVATRSPGTARQLSDRELAESPVLEAQRLSRLQKQEARADAGLSKIRRSE